MPKVHEEVVILKIYKLIKPGSTVELMVSDEIAENIASLAEEIVLIVIVLKIYWHQKVSIIMKLE
jgi:hypothetical protein